MQRRGRVCNERWNGVAPTPSIRRPRNRCHGQCLGWSKASTGPTIFRPRGSATHVLTAERSLFPFIRPLPFGQLGARKKRKEQRPSVTVPSERDAAGFSALQRRRLALTVAASLPRSDRRRKALVASATCWRGATSYCAAEAGAFRITTLDIRGLLADFRGDIARLQNLVRGALGRGAKERPSFKETFAQTAENATWRFPSARPRFTKCRHQDFVPSARPQ